MPTCVLTGVELTAEVDSIAHIIPSALCGHLRPRGLLSRQANLILNEKVDQPLIATFAHLVTLLGGRRDRGDFKPLDVTDTNGTIWRFDFGQPLRPRDPKLTVLPQLDGSVFVEATARTRRHLRQVLGKAAKDHPGLDLDATLGAAEDEHEPGDTFLHVGLDLDEHKTFPACWTMMVLFARQRTGWLHPLWRGYINRLDPAKKAPLPPATYFLVSRDGWFDDPLAPTICHRLVVKGSTSLGILFGYVELFGTLCVASVLSDQWQGGDCEHAYVWDVVNGQQIGGLRVREEVWADLPHKNPDSDTLGKFIAERTRNFLSTALSRHYRATTESQIGEAVRTGLNELQEGDMITPEIVNRILEEVMRRVFVPRMRQRSDRPRPRGDEE